VNTNLTNRTDAEDDAMRKWKESLGLGTGTPLLDEKDPRTCIILSLGLEVEGRPDIVLDLSKPGQLETLKSKPFIIKEGAKYRMKVRFRVQRQILSGLKYLQVVKRAGLSQKQQEMIGSYGPSTKEKPEYEQKCMFPTIDGCLRRVLTQCQLSPKRHQAACSLVVTTKPFLASLTTITTSICVSNGLSISRRTGKRLHLSLLEVERLAASRMAYDETRGCLAYFFQSFIAIHMK
jgi:RHO protein GDP dissociation inhibitor